MEERGRRAPGAPGLPGGLRPQHGSSPPQTPGVPVSECGIEGTSGGGETLPSACFSAFEDLSGKAPGAAASRNGPLASLAPREPRWQGLGPCGTRVGTQPVSICSRDMWCLRPRGHCHTSSESPWTPNNGRGAPAWDQGSSHQRPLRQRGREAEAPEISLGNGSRDAAHGDREGLCPRI